jgi:mono/diheme cytochrome c family protein
VSAVLAFVSFPLLAHTEQNNAARTTLSSVYTPDQAAKGEALYQDKCAKCHDGDDAAGPSLSGRTFIDRWREDNLDVLFNFISSNMPADSAGSLSDSEYIDVVAHLLDGNGFPAGSQQLTVEALLKIRFVGKDGPKPLPNNTIVLVVGCLEQTADNAWTLTNASDPVRDRQGTETNPEELKKSAAKARGSATFNLANFNRISLDFNPEVYKGHRLQIKGVLIHQANANDRISITALNSLAPNCAQ